MQLGAKALLDIVIGIRGQIKQAMQQTNGVISWEQLAQFIAGGEDKVKLVGAIVLRRHVMPSKDFRYYIVTTTLPQCNSKMKKAW